MPADRDDLEAEPDDVDDQAERRAATAEKIDAAKARLAARKAERARAAARAEPTPVREARASLLEAQAETAPPPADPAEPEPTAAPTEDAMPKSPAPKPSPLLRELLAACDGYGAKSACAKALGRSPSFFTDCLRRGDVPEDMRDQVRAWIDGRTAAPLPPADQPPFPSGAVQRGFAVRVHRDGESRVSRVKAASRADAVQMVAAAHPGWTMGCPPRPASGTKGVDLPALLQALGIQPQAVYLVEDGRLVERQAVVI